MQIVGTDGGRPLLVGGPTPHANCLHRGWASIIWMTLHPYNCSWGLGGNAVDFFSVDVRAQL